MARLYHGTTRQILASIQEHGLLVRKANHQAKIKAGGLHTSSQSAWSVVHTMRKHGVAFGASASE